MFNESEFQNLDSPYYTPNELITFSKEIPENIFSIFHVNIRSVNKNFEKLKNLLQKINYSFKVIVLSESWLKDENAHQNSLYQIPNYIPIHQIRKGSKGGGVSIYIHKTLNYKLRNDISICHPDIEALSIEIIKENKKNLIITGLYRPPRGDEKNFRKEYKKLIENKNVINKQKYLIGDINLNSLDYETKKSVKKFFNFSFKNSIFPIITRPTRVTRTTITSIDHILTNAILTNTVHSGILQTDISDHFPIFTFIEDEITKNESGTTTIFKREINEKTKETFKNMFKNYDWNPVINENNPNNSYDKFIEIYFKAYDIAFPIKEVSIKTKSLLNPWFTEAKGIKKSSNKKQKLYEKLKKKKK